MSNQQQDTAARGLSLASQKLLVRQLVGRYPLPWRLEFDWTVEVTDAAGTIIVKCMHIDQANEILELAVFVANEDENAREEIERMLQEPTP